MFDFSFTEMMLAGVVALVVLGPERLPKVARKAGEWAGKARSMANSLKTELGKQAELAELQKMKTELQQAAKEVKTDLDEISNEIGEIDRRPAWDKLPEQRSPADFDLDNYGHALPHNANPNNFSGFHQTSSYMFNSKSLHKQSMTRKRDRLPRYHAKPRLRSKK